MQASIKSGGRSAGTMFAFLLVAMILIALTNNFTYLPIRENQHNKLISKLKSISDIDADIAWTNIEQGKLPIVLCSHKNQHLGWLSRIEAEGYAGPIDILIGVNASNTITGLTILSHRETPGIGDIIEEEKSAWLKNFVNLGTEIAMLAPLRLRLRSEGGKEGGKESGKESGEIDAVTGATITTTAVMQSIQAALIALPWSSIETGKILCKP